MGNNNKVSMVARATTMAAVLAVVPIVTLLVGIPASANGLTSRSCGNAPKPEAEFLSDRCNWQDIETATTGAEPVEYSVQNADTTGAEIKSLNLSELRAIGRPRLPDPAQRVYVIRQGIPKTNQDPFSCHCHL
jgi:hypothetical protein